MTLFEIACLTDRGATLAVNEDRLLIDDQILSGGRAGKTAARCLTAVCDGVGGQAGGALAAEAACEVLRAFGGRVMTAQLAERFVSEANASIRERQRAVPCAGDMATTVAALYLDKGTVLAFNLGDSSVFRYRWPYIALLSSEDTVKAENRCYGLETGAAQAHVITKCLNGGPPIKPYVFSCDSAREGDVFLLCSDGLTDVLGLAELEAVLAEPVPLTQQCESLFTTAIERGTEDNISIVLIRRV